MASMRQRGPARPGIIADPVDVALASHRESSLRSPRMFDADDTDALRRRGALEARQIAVDLWP